MRSRRTLPYQAAWAVMGIASAALISGCEIPGLGKDPGAENARRALATVAGAGGGTGAEVFRAQVRPLLQEAKCSVCHSSSGGRTPYVASNNEEEAYVESKRYTNFSSPDQSIMLVQADDRVGHCKPTCTELGRARWAAALHAWADAERSGGGDTGGGGNTGGGGGDPWTIVSPELTIPQNLPANQVFTLDLASMGADYSGASLQMTVESNAGTLGPDVFRISDLRFVNRNTGSVAYAVQGVYVIEDGEYVPAYHSSFAEVSTVIGPAPNGSTPNSAILSPRSMLLGGNAAAHRLRFGFYKLERTVVRNCANLAGFRNNVMVPILLATTTGNKCLQCHGGGNATAAARFRFPTTVPGAGSPEEQAFCASVLQRTNVDNPADSAILNYPQGQNGHPNRTLSNLGTSQVTAADFQAMRSWIESE